MEKKGGLGRGVRLIVHCADEIVGPPVEGMSQAAWGELSVAESADSSGDSACGAKKPS